MSLIFLDSFDHYTEILDKWDSRAGLPPTFGVAPTQAAGRFTPGALLVSGIFAGGSSATKNLPDTDDIYIGFAYNDFDALGFDDQLFIQGPEQAILTLSSTSGIAKIVYDGHTVQSASGIMTGAVWQFMEIHIKQHATLGEIEIRRNGVSIASQTSIDTLGGDFTAITFGAGGSAEHYYVDDLYVLNGLGTVNNTFAGDSRITVLRPKANGLDNNFTPTGAASNFEAVDETTHDADTTYNEAGQVGAAEEYTNFTFSDLGIAPGTIFGVQVVNACKKTDAGQLNYKDEMIIGGLAFDDGTEVVASSGDYKMSTFIRDTDPSDNGTWTEAKVDAVGSALTITLREV